MDNTTYAVQDGVKHFGNTALPNRENPLPLLIGDNLLAVFTPKYVNEKPNLPAQLPFGVIFPPLCGGVLNLLTLLKLIVRVFFS